MTAISGRSRAEVAYLQLMGRALYIAHRAHFGASDAIGSRRRFCHGFISVSIQAQQRLRSIGLHPSTPPFHHTPRGLLSWQLDRTAITATSGYGVPCGLPGAPLTAILRPRWTAATHPKVVWCGPGQPTHLTVCRPW